MATSGVLNTSNQYVKYKITITQNSQNITGNTSNVTVSVRFYRTNTGYSTYGSGTVYCKINGTTRSATVTSSQKITSSGIVLYTWTGNISHNADGKKTLTCSAWINLNTPLTSSEQSYSQTLTTIPRASNLTVSNGTLGTAQTLTINRAVDTFKHRIAYTCGNVSGYAAGSGSTYTTATSISWTPPMSLASQNITGTSVSIKLTLHTYTNGGTLIGSMSKTVTAAIPAGVKPSCSVAVADVTGWADTYGYPVQGLSKLKITITPTLSYGSPIAVYTSGFNGVKYTTATATTELLRIAGDPVVTASVKDKRGRTGSASKSVHVLPYAPPRVYAMTVHRCDAAGVEDDQGEYIIATFSASVAPVANKNVSNYKVRYKKTTDASYTEVSLADLTNEYTVTKGEYIFIADSNSSYDVEVEVTDRHGTATRSASASTAFTLMNWGPDGTSMGIGKVAEKENTLQIGLNTEAASPVKLIGAERIDLTVAAGFTVYNGEDYNRPTVYKNGAGMVELVGRVSPATANTLLASTVGEIMFTIPEGFRPVVSFAEVMQGSGSATWLMTVEDNGVVRASRYRNGDTYETPDTSAWFPFHVTYMAEY